MEYKRVSKMVERPTVQMKAVALAPLVEATRIPPEQRPTVRMHAVVVTPSMMRMAAAQ